MVQSSKGQWSQNLLLHPPEPQLAATSWWKYCHDKELKIPGGGSVERHSNLGCYFDVSTWLFLVLSIALPHQSHRIIVLWRGGGASTIWKRAAPPSNTWILNKTKYLPLGGENQKYNLIINRRIDLLRQREAQKNEAQIEGNDGCYEETDKTINFPGRLSLGLIR